MLGVVRLADNESSSHDYVDYRVAVRDPGRLIDLAVVARSKNGAEDFAAAVSWVEFVGVPSTDRGLAKIVLIPVQTDDAQEAADVRQCCQLLASCLNRQDQAMAIVSPEDNWPAEPLACCQCPRGRVL